MKSKILLFVIATLMFTACATNTSPDGTATTKGSPLREAGGYDSLLAARTGADQYGMKKYVLAFLKKGPNRDQDSATSAQLQAAHMRNIQRMADEGKLVLAGPFMDDQDFRGIYIFNTSSTEEAKEWTSTDPAVQAGRLEMELHPWFGSAALMEVNSLHKRLQKTDIVPR